jgi:acyl-coenzyme A thioesterase PaaI-like protein
VIRTTGNPSSRRACATVEFEVNVMRPAVAHHFVAIGKVAMVGRTLAVCQGEVTGDKSPLRECIALMLTTMIYIAGNA